LIMKNCKLIPVYITALLLILPTLPVELRAQESKSNPVKFTINKSVDQSAPSIEILSPSFSASGYYKSEVEEVELIGEAKDQSRIRFVSINNDIKVTDATGLFVSTLRLKPGENKVRVKSMDEHNNMQEVVLTLEYRPPVVTLADRINEKSTYYGLIIGIDEYEDPNIVDLDNPVYDAETIFRSLTEHYTFEPENVSLLKNPTRNEIIWELDALREKITEEDNLLIFYAGHGYWDEKAKIGYWLPSDAQRKTTADWFRNSALVDYLQALQTKHTLLITDACFAGSIFKTRSVKMDEEVAYDRIYEMPSRKAMTSGALTEVPDQSAFVKYLVKRLDDNGNPYLSSEELFHSFKMAVISNSGSEVLPLYGEIQNVGNEGGDFIFLKRNK